MARVPGRVSGPQEPKRMAAHSSGMASAIDSRSVLVVACERGAKASFSKTSGESAGIKMTSPGWGESIGAAWRTGSKQDRGWMLAPMIT